MNYWFAEMTGMDLVTPLFDYIEVSYLFTSSITIYTNQSFQKTWAPRGAETAQILYNISRGFVTHNEVSAFYHFVIKRALTNMLTVR